ncbi:MAG: hypothetical protein A2Y33_14380 [Spirochaetes bacterium GWF1_51_8]|nr:MAG: hypothetical protein A2Y33_14380 [Spirochaetes bacterium GWF1_51_8]
MKELTLSQNPAHLTIQYTTSIPQSITINADILNTRQSEISNKFLSMIFDSIVKKRIINNLFISNNYLNNYISFLLGAYSDDEFKSISEKYVREYDDNDISDIEIFYSVQILKNISKEDLNSENLLSMLNISPERLKNFDMKLLEK